MTVLILCLIVASLLPYLVKIPLAVAMAKDGGYDNRYPREQQSRLQGFGARSLASHQNAFESLLVFATAILLAITTGTTSENVQTLAIMHIGFRVLYHALYLLNMSTLRSVSWFIAIACSFAIMGQCLLHWA
ncbi:MAPEG family protein [Vibrio hangzhouensis]|uniref:MAPEG family protein n=1 Tax=Vibrio hangzhouensis TaxID=462991 RepID=UPI001C957718|nr:MAPEG family protein [Vibrio hangzhouensis]MBY6196855.1 MAPEG family protein [Vibrio hangzhouensis]